MIDCCFSSNTNKEFHQKARHNSSTPTVTSYSYAVTDFGEKTGTRSKTIQVIKNYISDHKPTTKASSDGNKSYSSIDTIVGYINDDEIDDAKYAIERLVDPSKVRYIEVEEEQNKIPKKSKPKNLPKLGTENEFKLHINTNSQNKSEYKNKKVGYPVDPKASISASIFGRGTPASKTLEKNLLNLNSYSNQGLQLSKSEIEENYSFLDNLESKDNVYKTIPTSVKYSNYSPKSPEIEVTSKTNISIKPRQIIHSTIRPPNTVTVTTTSGKRFDLPRSTTSTYLSPYISPTKTTPTPTFTSTGLSYIAPKVRNYFQQKAFDNTGPIFFPGVGYGGIIFNEQTGEPNISQTTSSQKSPGISSRLPPKPIYNYNKGFLFNLNANIKNPNYSSSLKPVVKTGRSRGFRFGG